MSDYDLGGWVFLGVFFFVWGGVKGGPSVFVRPFQTGTHCREQPKEAAKL